MVFDMVEDSLRTLALMNETGYSIQQDNGQRIYGPPPDWVGPAPKDTEIFIGKLPNDTYEYDIVPLFSSVGKIYMLRIMQNFSGLNRGFAFVQYSTPEEADKAINHLNNVEIRPGEKIGVVKSRNNCRLYIGKLDTTMTKDEIREELEKFTEDIVEVIIHKSEMPGQNNRGYAFVEYLTHKAAAKARRKLVPCKIKIRGVEVTVDWATPLHECGEILNVFNSLLIKNIRETAKNDELSQFYSLSNKLKIIKFKRLPNKLMISFNSREDAERAMQVYDEMKNTNEFNYFAEKNKRVEIVWLKNNMNLSAFTSSINYTPPKFYDTSRDDCNNSVHSHISNGSINNKQISDKNKPIKNMNGRVQLTQNSSNSYVLANNGTNLMMNNMKNSNQRYVQNNNYSTNNNFQNNKSNNNSNRLPMSSRSNALVNNRNMINGLENSNTLANRFNNNQLGNAIVSQPPLVNHQQSFTLANRLSPSIESNPFSANSFDLNNAWQSPTPPSHFNGNFNNGINDFNQLNASNNMNMIKRSDRSHLMLNSLNASYNFGIWRNYGNNNLDVSANWSKFKDHKVQGGSFTSQQSSCDTNNNISEDNCSIKSDYEYGGSETNFNYFNPINSLNLHENFRGLNVDQSLSKYPFYNPILQQQ